MNDKRERNKVIYVRASAPEYTKIKESYARSSHSNMNDFCVDMLQHGYIVNVDYSDLTRLIYEINKIGTNINQIAHKVNENESVGKADIERLKEQLSLVVHVVNDKFNSIK